MVDPHNPDAAAVVTPTQSHIDNAGRPVERPGAQNAQELPCEDKLPPQEKTNATMGSQTSTEP